MTENNYLLPDTWKYIFSLETSEFLLKRKLSEFDKSINPLLNGNNIDLEKFNVKKNISNDKIYYDDSYYNCYDITICEKDSRNFIECNLTPDEIKYEMHYEYDNTNRMTVVHRCDRNTETIFVSNNGKDGDEAIIYDLGANKKVSTVSNLRHIRPNDIVNLYGIIDGATSIANNLFSNDLKKCVK